MLTKIDWYSFTVKLPTGRGSDERETEKAILTELDRLSPMLEAWLEIDGRWKRTSGRAPYSIAWQHPSGGVTVFYHPRLDHALFEVSGKHCDFLDSRELSEDFLDMVKTRLTRLDIACDMLTTTRPTDFVAKREEGRFKAHSHIISESGETCYIGSRSSNRYARVYRYNPPHPRAELLRCEFVIKAEDARLTANAILTDGLLAVAAAMGTKFGWQHEVWQPESLTVAEIEAYRPERAEGKTVYWLTETIAPLIARLHREDIIDAQAWFAKNVLSKLDNPPPADEDDDDLNPTFDAIPF